MGVLIIEDDAAMREVLAFQVGEIIPAVDVAEDGEAGLRAFDAARHAIVVTDLKMPGMDGLTVLRKVLERAPDTLVVVTTAFGDVPVAVEAMKAGAFDFIAKPFDREHLRAVLRKALSLTALRSRVSELEDTLGWGERSLVYSSAAMGRVVARIDRVASSDATVLLAGESGTGKELLAHRLHARSPRHAGPFVAVNCGAIPRELLESELFGHARGAFTGAVSAHKGRFEVATGGTLFLDEIGELPLDLQPKLLRALESGAIDVLGHEKPHPIDARIVVATHRELGGESAAGRFRSDLYFRLAVVEVRVPPLRERPEDVPVLVEHFLAKWGRDRHFQVAPDAMATLSAAAWPGNVRELENVVRRFCLLCEGDLIDAGCVREAVQSSSMPAAAPASAGIVLPPEGVSLRDLEKEVILTALRQNDFNQSRTAKFLRIPRHILLYRMKKYGIGESGAD